MGYKKQQDIERQDEILAREILAKHPDLELKKKDYYHILNSNYKKGITIKIYNGEINIEIYRYKKFNKQQLETILTAITD